MKNTIMLIDLQLFADGAAAGNAAGASIGGSAGGAGAISGETGASAGSAAGVSGSAAAGNEAALGDRIKSPLDATKGKAKRQALKNVKYGRNVNANASQAAADTLGAAADAKSSGKYSEAAQKNAQGQIPGTAQNTAVGTNPESAPNAVPESTKNTSDAKTSFEELIKGEYKEQFNERVQSIIDKRFKETKNLEAHRDKIAPVLDILATKYGVGSDNIERLAKAIQDDDSYYEQEALEKGITVESLKSMKKMERENADIKEALRKRDEVDGARQNYARLVTQMDGLKKVYPSFDIRTEMQNQKFAQLVRNPAVDLRTAYEVVHKDEIIPAAMKFAAQQVERKITNNILANGNRPSENGINTSSASVIKSDPKNLSKDDRKEIRRRVSQGEKIFW